MDSRTSARYVTSVNGGSLNYSCEKKNAVCTTGTFVDAFHLIQEAGKTVFVNMTLVGVVHVASARSKPALKLVGKCCTKTSGKVLH